MQRGTAEARRRSENQEDLWQTPSNWSSDSSAPLRSIALPGTGIWQWSTAPPDWQAAHVSLRVLVAPDKFKGTLSAQEAAGAIVNGWWAARPQDEMEMLPISDGGDGFGALLAGLMSAEERSTSTVDAAHQPVTARWWYHAETACAVIESALVVGLAMLPPGKHHPFDLDSLGLAAVIQDALAAGAQRLILGIGGSATNDGGFGVARGIGWKFFDDRDQEITNWVKLSRLTRLEPPGTPLPGVEFIVAVDVENPLLGLNGCTRVYGPQKGLLPQQAPVAESALERLAARVQSASGMDVAAESGAGAAGGLGFGLRSFFGAQLYSGFDLFADAARLDDRIRAVDLVITGEGAIDRQSLMGKGTGRLAQRCRTLEKRCIGLAGVVEGAAKSPTADRLFHAVHSITPTLTSPAEARKDAALWLQRLANRVGPDYFDS